MTCFTFFSAGIPDSIGTQFVLVVDYDRGYEERPEILLSTMENHPVSTTVREEPMAGFSVTVSIARTTSFCYLYISL